MLFSFSPPHRTNGGREGKEKKRKNNYRIGTIHVGNGRFLLVDLPPHTKGEGVGTQDETARCTAFFFLLFFFFSRENVPGEKKVQVLSHSLLPPQTRESEDGAEIPASAPSRPVPAPSNPQLFSFFSFFFSISSGSRITYFIPSVLNHGWKPPKPNRNQTLGVAKRKQKVSK